MELDIRLPIGLLFSLIGLLLTGFGLLGDKEIYTRSLGYNVNLLWGIALCVFGALMLWFGVRATRRGARA
jgi:hypothetical protein